MKKIKYTIFGLVFFSLSALPATPAKASTGFTFNFKDQQFVVSPNDLASWQGAQTVTPSNILNPPIINFKESLRELSGQTPNIATASRFFNYKLSAVYNYVSGLAKTINVPMVDPVLKITDGVATEFTPPQQGQMVDSYQTSINALQALAMDKQSTDILTYETDPKTDLSQTNSLGINELIAHGVSGFKGSPNNRRHNIAVGLEKFKGVIIPKGAQFSFNDVLGPVEAEQGFLPELVIKGDLGTIPELGGGLCQVSTTTFRAAMAAGLPITDRRNHAYAVQYYSPQGTDATIYPGSADLRFINDTPGAILIWPYEPDKNTLVFDFYGTKDSREVTLQKPVVYDRQPDGSMKATWTRLVTSANGKTRTDVFKSVYQSPALFHKSEQFVPAATSTTKSLLAPTPAKIQ